MNTHSGGLYAPNPTPRVTVMYSSSGWMAVVNAGTIVWQGPSIRVSMILPVRMTDTVPSKMKSRVSPR